MLAVASWKYAEILAFAVPHHLRDRGWIVVMTSIWRKLLPIVLALWWLLSLSWRTLLWHYDSEYYGYDYFSASTVINITVSAIHGVSAGSQSLQKHLYDWRCAVQAAPSVQLKLEQCRQNLTIRIMTASVSVSGRSSTKHWAALMNIHACVPPTYLPTYIHTYRHRDLPTYVCMYTH